MSCEGCERRQLSADRSRSMRRLAATLGLVVLYMAAEVVGGLLTGSLALLADAGHMLSDAASIGLAIFAIWFARQPAGPGHTYGYYRTEILVAMINSATLIAIAIFISFEAIRRFAHPPSIAGGPMAVIAAGGLLVNLIGLWLLHGERHENLNLRGAWLHVASDLLGSVQTLIAAALIWALGWNWVDPLASLLIALLVVYSAWGLLRESVAVLMERAPGHIDVDEVRAALFAPPDVIEVHDLHIWTITSGLHALSVHLVTSGPHPRPGLLRELQIMLRDRFGIDHTTIQIEPEEFQEGEVAV